MMYWKNKSNYTGTLPINKYAQSWLKNYNTKKNDAKGKVTEDCYIWNGK